MNRSQVISQIREALHRIAPGRSEERRVGKECRSRWSQGGMLAQIVILICCYC